MSSHEELDEQFQTAVDLDTEREQQRITREEFDRGVEAVSKWPQERGKELLKMRRNERHIMLLLAGELDAYPEESEEGEDCSPPS